MFDTAIGFSIIISIIITSLIYFINREKNKTEQEQKDKFNDLIILFIITFVVVLFTKICLLDKTSSSTILVKQSDSKGGQCPF